MNRPAVISAMMLLLLPPAVATAESSGHCAGKRCNPARCCAAADSVADPARDSVLARMDDYLEAVDRLSVPYAESETDFMIGVVRDSALRNAVAVKAYEHFRNSKVMGSENVAVHIYDKWFATFKAVFDNIDKLDEAEFYAFVNRRSLIGKPAVRLEMESLDGGTVEIPFGNGRKSIIYFYSTECPKCLYYSVKLRDWVKGSDPDADLFAVYTGNDPEAWRSYVSRELAFSPEGCTGVYHLCGGDSDFVTAYGVVQTPRLFLVDGDGIIIGRNLDVDALALLAECE